MERFRICRQKWMLSACIIAIVLAGNLWYAHAEMRPVLKVASWICDSQYALAYAGDRMRRAGRCWLTGSNESPTIHILWPPFLNKPTDGPVRIIIAEYVDVWVRGQDIRFILE